MLTDDLIKEMAVKVADDMMAELIQVDFSECVDLAEYISSKNVEKSMRAVLAKAMPIPKQKPVAFGIYSENGDIEAARKLYKTMLSEAPKP